MSMPYVGLLLFLRNQGGSTGNLLVCQCPTSGFFYFYEEVLYVVGAIAVVSMPYVGLLLFLPKRFCCMTEEHNCVNALRRASSISTAVLAHTDSTKEMCQCPTSGFFYFYQSLGCIPVDGFMCQCPTSGFFYFYRRN